MPPPISSTNGAVQIHITEGPSPTITRLGLAGEDPLCAATLQLFSTLHGSEAGNLASCRCRTSSAAILPSFSENHP